MDMDAGKLVECSSTQQCPHAKPVFSLARNATILANEAPTIQNVAFVALNKYTLAVYKPIVGQTLTLLSGAGAGLTVSHFVAGLLHVCMCVCVFGAGAGLTDVTHMSMCMPHHNTHIELARPSAC